MIISQSAVNLLSLCEQCVMHVISLGGEENLMVFQPISQSHATGCQSHGICKRSVLFFFNFL